MEIRHQVIVVGAGPAGLNAANSAAKAGCEVGLIDSAYRLGGQYWRHSGVADFDDSMHHNFKKASQLMDQVRSNPRIHIYSQKTIWSASVIGGEIILRMVDGTLITTKLILATGAYDRSIPFPGWDIPGVMTAGAAQSLLKGSGVLAGKKIVVAGSGPFLLPVAAGLNLHQGEVIKILEATSAFAWRKGLWALLQNPKKMVEALSYLKTIRKYQTSTRFRQAIVEAQAGPDGLLKSVKVAHLDSEFRVRSTYFLECDLAAIGWGFTPDTSLAALLSVKQVVDIDGSVKVEVDELQRAQTPHAGVEIFAAGEITGVGGSDLALLEGEIAGLAAANSLGSLNKLKRQRRRAQKFSRALQKVYAIPLGWKSWLTPDSLICRCEEVSYDNINRAIEDYGVTDLRGIKLMTRCGMGLCQGRICSRAISDLVDSSDSDRIGSSKRPIISPITFGELATEGLL